MLYSKVLDITNTVCSNRWQSWRNTESLKRIFTTSVTVYKLNIYFKHSYTCSFSSLVAYVIVWYQSGRWKDSVRLWLHFDGSELLKKRIDFVKRCVVKYQYCIIARQIQKINIQESTSLRNNLKRLNCIIDDMKVLELSA